MERPAKVWSLEGINLSVRNVQRVPNFDSYPGVVCALPRVRLVSILANV